jgi:hypothetical protein
MVPRNVVSCKCRRAHAQPKKGARRRGWFDFCCDVHEMIVQGSQGGLEGATRSRCPADALRARVSVSRHAFGLAPVRAFPGGRSQAIRRTFPSLRQNCTSASTLHPSTTATVVCGPRRTPHQDPETLLRALVAESARSPDTARAHRRAPPLRRSRSLVFSVASTPATSRLPSLRTRRPRRHLSNGFPVAEGIKAQTLYGLAARELGCASDVSLEAWATSN